MLRSIRHCHEDLIQLCLQLIWKAYIVHMISWCIYANIKFGVFMPHSIITCFFYFNPSHSSLRTYLVYMLCERFEWKNQVWLDEIWNTQIQCVHICTKLPCTWERYSTLFNISQWCTQRVHVNIFFPFSTSLGSYSTVEDFRPQMRRCYHSRTRLLANVDTLVAYCSAL
jgi:hypothetical protein